MVKRDKANNFLLPNTPTWIVAGDSAEARIFLTEKRFGEWAEVARLANPEAATRERDRGTDRPGRVFDSFGKGRHAMAPEETGQQHEIHRFAHNVGSYLNKGHSAGAFDHLVLIAEPSFLGYLRQELSAVSKKSVVCEIAMNPKGHDVEKLKSLLT
jgi:protein required for attachment to host cells